MTDLILLMIFAVVVLGFSVGGAFLWAAAVIAGSVVIFALLGAVIWLMVWPK